MSERLKTWLPPPLTTDTRVETIRMPSSPPSSQPSAQPVIRWAGSKRKLLPNLLELAPKTFGEYFEPFVGSACLFFALNPKRATLGDINKELISAYRTLRRDVHSVVRVVESYPRTKVFYYRLRDKCTPTTSVERTARFLYLNRFCFNGLYRTNRAGRFNVPRGERTGEIPDVAAFTHAAKMLRGKRLLCADFEETVANVKRNDFVYLDPPYASSGHRDRNEYGLGSFNPSDIPRLLRTLEFIHARGAHFLLSYSTAPDFIAQLPPHTLRTVSVRRSIASNPAFRSSVPEILLTNENLYSHASDPRNK